MSHPHDRGEDVRQRKIEILNQALNIACYQDASSPTGKAVFFSGAAEKRQAAEFCRKNPGYKHVCMTDALQAFDRLELFKNMPPLTIGEIYDIGDMISERFASEASGNVTAFIGPKCKPHGTFLRVELPALLNNPGVTTINGNPKEDYAYLLQRDGGRRREIGASVAPPLTPG